MGKLTPVIPGSFSETTWSSPSQKEQPRDFAKLDCGSGIATHFEIVLIRKSAESIMYNLHFNLHRRTNDETKEHVLLFLSVGGTPVHVQVEQVFISSYVFS